MNKLENQRLNRSKYSRERKREILNRRDPVGCRLSNLRTRSKRNNLPFDLTREDFKNIPECCPILGIPIRFNHPNRDNRLSVDRIINSDGYTRNNIVFVSLKANVLKSDMDLETMKTLYEFYRAKIEDVRRNKRASGNNNGDQSSGPQ